MGRYAFFNTGLEYKFVFACQESTDMQMFGGEQAEPKDVGYYAHEWDAEIDLPFIRRRLERFVNGAGIALPDFEQYDRSESGTYALRRTLDEKEDEYIDIFYKEFYTYRLGCLIYHQLLYMPKLTVNYE